MFIFKNKKKIYLIFLLNRKLYYLISNFQVIKKNKNSID
jgi:hypothetical protein